MMHVIELWQRYDKLRFLIVGGWNFVFGYCQFAFFYWWLNGSWSDFAILVLTNIVGITQSFLTHRYLTFSSKGNFWKEYMKFYAVYGVQALVGMGAFYVFVTRLGFNAYFTNLVINILLTVASYWAHKHFSFKIITKEQIFLTLLPAFRFTLGLLFE